MSSLSAENVGDEPMDTSKVDELIARYGTTRRFLVDVLKGVQEHFHYLPQAAIIRISELTPLTPAAIVGVASFYSQFRFTPAGEHIVKVCFGTACHVKGADDVYDGLLEELCVDEGDDTDPDGLFTLEKVGCLGCCMLDPAVQVGEIIYGHVDRNKVPRLIEDFLSSRTGLDGRRNVSRNAGKLPARGEIRICTCSSCRAAGAQQVFVELNRQIEAYDIPAVVGVVGCTGISYDAPVVDIAMDTGSLHRYGRTKVSHVRHILTSHFKPRRAVGELRVAAMRVLDRLYSGGREEPVTRYHPGDSGNLDAPNGTGQCHVATERAGVLDPLDIDAYKRAGGFEALNAALNDLTPEMIIERITSSGLRGRGGGGFSTGKKWETVGKHDDKKRYIVCNGDEGDPGAFMNRILLESFPFRVVEGMLIAARAVGADEGFLYVRNEYTLALKRVEEALNACRKEGLVGPAVDITVATGAGAFVCGEETALTAAIEGRRGMPSLRPPYPADRGLWGLPTLINNVETFACIPWIISNGPEAFSEIGSAKSRGTKTFALAGKIRRGGLIEVPLGTTIREIVEEALQ